MPRCRSLLFVLLIAAAPCAFAGADDAAQKFSLGGPRKVTAEITGDADHLDVAVRMIGVRAFDSATNDRCNREKATGYAHAALKQHLAPGARKASMKITGEEVIDAGYDGNVFKLALRVPRNGVTISEVVGKPTATAKRAKKRVPEAPTAGDEPEVRASSSGLLTAKQDYLVALECLNGHSFVKFYCLQAAYQNQKRRVPRRHVVLQDYVDGLGSKL